MTDKAWYLSRIFEDIVDEVICETMLEGVREIMDVEDKKKSKDEEKAIEIELTQEELRDILMEEVPEVPEVETMEEKVDNEEDEMKLSQEEVHELLTTDITEDFIVENIENLGDGNDEESDQIRMNEYINKQKNVNTAKKTEQVIRRFKDWLIGEKKEERALLDIPVERMNQYVGNFLIDLKKQNGEDMEPDTITSFHRGIDRYLRENNYPEEIMKSEKFNSSRKILTAKRNELKGLGLGNKPNRADTITDDMVEKLWDSKELGAETPRSVQNKVFFYLTQGFGFRGSHESKQMAWGDVHLKFDDDNKEFLEFNEKLSKTRTGELGTGVRAFAPKLWSTGTDRCPIFYYKLFRDHRPTEMCKDDSPFYLTVKNKVKSTDAVWYSRMAMGKNSICKFVPRMASNAGLKGKITNHSLRKKTCQDLLSADVPPVIICQLTGHRNVNSLQNYTFANMNQQKNMSNILVEPSGKRKACFPAVEGSEKVLALPSTSGASNLDVQNASGLGLDKLVKASSGILANSTINGNVSLNINFHMSSSQSLNMSPKGIGHIE